uniref:Uncharacterized protein n=1 Tax=Anopheles dirus TaxID=7168 RepID=A0A182NXP8_9DIPT
ASRVRSVRFSSVFFPPWPVGEERCGCDFKPSTFAKISSQEVFRRASAFAFGVPALGRAPSGSKDQLRVAIESESRRVWFSKKKNKK